MASFIGGVMADTIPMDPENPEVHSKKFTGWWIPAAIVLMYERDEISMKEMVLLATIDSLVDRETGVGCYAGNKWLAKKIKMASDKTVATMITKLKKMGLLAQVGFDGRRRYLETTWTRVRGNQKPTFEVAPRQPRR